MCVAALLHASPAKAQQKAMDNAADIVRFAPYASVFALKACGVESRSETWGELTVNAALSAAIACGTTFALKKIVKENRPDGSDDMSFPSGHATVAFAGATMLHKEYGHISPWISIGGFSLATAIAASRVTGDHHYIHDVAAGAAIGVLGTELSYHLTRRLFPKGNGNVAIAGTTIDIAIRL